MATLTEYYEEVDAKRASLRVVIAGVQVARVQSASWQFAIGRVPSASIRIANPPAGIISFFADVYIEAGFNNVMQRVFTGKVMHVNPDEQGCNIECVGKSWPLDFHWHEIIYTFSGVTAEASVTAMLVAAGITDYFVDLPAWTIGTVCEQTLSFQTYGEAINKVAEVDGGRWYETPNGTVRVEVCDQIPALNAWRAYFGMELTGITEGYPAGLSAPARPRLRQVKVDQEIREAKNQAIVRGCTYTQTNADGTEDSIDVEGRAFAPSPWILTPAGGQAYNDILFSNELVDTPAKAASVAVRLVTVLNRLLTRIGVTVDGDPQAFLRGTVQVEDPGYSRVTGNWFTESYRTTIDERDCVTVLDLRGGAEAGGHITICPMAIFSHVGDREVMGDRVWVVVTFDGRGSVDPDGTTLTYSWSDNQAPQIATGTDSVITVRADPDTLSTPWEVTLTVTDSDGCSDSITLTIPVDPGSEDLFIPAIFAAFDQWFSGSPDGGVNWNDSADPGGDAPVVISVGAKVITDGTGYGTAWFGTSAGAIYKTEDYCATAPTLVMAAVGSPIEHIWPDMNWPPDAWAVTRDGRLYRSPDDGDTWVLYDDLKTVFDLPDIRLSRIGTPAPDGVWVFGGTGEAPGPLIAFDPTRTHNWFQATLGGELLEDLGGTGGTAEGPVGAQARGADYEFLRHDPGDWVEQSATAPPVSGGFCWIKNLAGTLFRLNTRDAYKVGGSLQRSPDDGVTWTEEFAGDVANRRGFVDYDRAADGTLWALWGDSDTAGAVAPVVYKSIDDGQTWNTVHTFFSNLYHPLSIACHPTDANKIAFICMYFTSPYTIYLGYTTDGGTGWTEKTCSFGVSATAWQNNQIIWGASDRLLVTSSGANMCRVCDNWSGACTWTNKLTAGATDEFWQIVRGANTSEFFLLRNTTGGGAAGYISRSTDNGDTWTLNWAQCVADCGFADIATAIAYDDYSDILYAGAGNISAPPDKIVARWDAVAGWADLTDDIFAETGAETQGQGWLLCPVATGTPPAPADIYIKEAASREAGELAIILDSDSHTPAVYYTWDIHSADGAEWSRCLNCPAKPHGRWIAPDYEFGKFCFGFNDVYNYRGDVAAGVMTATLAPGELNPEQEPNHGVWIGMLIGGMAGCYIVAAMDVVGFVTPGMLYKTWDRFETDPVPLLRPAAGFPACEAGSRGYMVAFEGQGVPGDNPAFSGRVLIAGKLTGADRFAAWRLDEDSWNHEVFNGGEFTAATDILLPRALTSQLWFVLGFDGYATYCDTDNKIVRTKDGGDNWASFAQPKGGNDYWQDFAVGADGLIWGLTLDTITDVRGISKVWYSDDEGDTWTLAGSRTGAAPNYERLWRIVCHPNDNRVIAVLGVTGSSSTQRLTWYTEDKGTTWDTNILAAPTIEDAFAQSNDAIMTDNGRIIWAGLYLLTTVTSGVAYSDDFGATWTTAKDFGAMATHNNLGPVANQLGSRIYVLHYDNTDALNKVTEIWYSTDYGGSWTQLDNDVTQQGGTHFGEGGLALDEVAKALIVLNDGGIAANTWLLSAAKPIEKTSEWVDFSDTLVPVDGAASYSIGGLAQHICAIPR